MVGPDLPSCDSQLGGICSRLNGSTDIVGGRDALSRSTRASASGGATRVHEALHSCSLLVPSAVFHAWLLRLRRLDLCSFCLRGLHLT